MILVHGQIPLYARPNHGWPAYSLVGSVAKPIPPSPFLPGFVSPGGGGWAHHKLYVVDKRKQLENRDRQEVDDLVVLFLVWLLVENGMAWLASDVIKKHVGEADEDILPLMWMWLEVVV